MLEKKRGTFPFWCYLQVLQMLKLAELWPQRPRNIGIAQVPEMGSMRGRKGRKARTKKGKQEEEKKENVQTNDMIVGVASDMKPGAGIDQGRVPALQHVCGVRQPASQRM